MSSLSSAFALRETESQGRYTVATRDISPGEVLVKCEPYACALDVNRMKDRCFACLAAIGFEWAGWDCDKCHEVYFCCQECKDTFMK